MDNVVVVDVMYYHFQYGLSIFRSLAASDAYPAFLLLKRTSVCFCVCGFFVVWLDFPPSPLLSHEF